jgi:phosphoenolpyruvate-protein kinase (PTS system EI component)
MSATSVMVPRVKKAVQSLDAVACGKLAVQALESDDSAAILELSRSMAMANYADLMD